MSDGSVEDGVESLQVNCITDLKDIVAKII